MDENENSIDKEEQEIKNESKKTKKIAREILEWIFCFFVAYVIYLNINYFFGTISGVKQVSMLPTAVQGERLVIQRSTIFKRDLKYGDIITFLAPQDAVTIKDESDVTAKYDEYTGFSSFLYNFVGIGQMSYIKRVIGMAGDHIVIGTDGIVYRNDQPLEEPYLKDGTTSQNGSYVDVVVPDNCIFVMGDNRLESKDSRSFGCIPIDKVNGYVTMRVWPLNKWGKL